MLRKSDQHRESDNRPDECEQQREADHLARIRFSPDKTDEARDFSDPRAENAEKKITSSEFFLIAISINPPVQRNSNTVWISRLFRVLRVFTRC